MSLIKSGNEAKCEENCQQHLHRTPAGLCLCVNRSGSGLRAGIGNDVEEEERVAETEQSARHIKDAASQTVHSSQDRKLKF